MEIEKFPFPCRIGQKYQEFIDTNYHGKPLLLRLPTERPTSWNHWQRASVSYLLRTGDAILVIRKNKTHYRSNYIFYPLEKLLDGTIPKNAIHRWKDNYVVEYFTTVKKEWLIPLF